jgi:ATP-dependent DNA ligase
VALDEKGRPSKSMSCRRGRTRSGYSPSLETGPPKPIRSVKEHGLEGLVAKRPEQKQPALRSGAWKKMRVNRGQDLVIAGYTPLLKNFDAFIIGYYEGEKLAAGARD